VPQQTGPASMEMCHNRLVPHLWNHILKYGVRTAGLTSQVSTPGPQKQECHNIATLGVEYFGIEPQSPESASLTLLHDTLDITRFESHTALNSLYGQPWHVLTSLPFMQDAVSSPLSF